MIITIQTTASPELFRQALEQVTGIASNSNKWSISTAGNQATINSELDQTTLESIATFLEATPDYSPKFYTYKEDSFKENLVALRLMAIDLIDQEAGIARGRYLTAITGQEATYLAKEADSRAYKAARYPSDATGYEWVQSEADATGLSLKEAADSIIATADAWRVKGSEIEKVRRGGKIDIEKKLKASTIQASLEATLNILQGL